MPTPKTGAITMNDINLEIKRGTTLTQCSLDDVRTRSGYGGGAISFSNLRGAEGGQITQARYTFKSINNDGFSTALLIGSCTPNESNGCLQFAANSFMPRCVTNSADAGNTIMWLTPAAGEGSANASLMTTGYKTTDISKVAIDGADQPITTTVSNTTSSYVTLTHTMGSSGTVDFFIRFA